MYRDKQLTSEQLRDLLRINVVSRNELLNTVMGMLNSVESNAYFSIDGRWGSGKSVFINHLELLSYINTKDADSLELFQSAGLDEATVTEFQKNYIAYYYNAWENDDHVDPIQSLLFNIINDYQVKDGLKGMVANTSKQVAKDSLISGVKTLSRGFVDLDSLKQVATVNDLVKDITTSNERKKAVSSIIDTLVPEGKKLLLLIDELDRCAPSFAVSMLETIKHYYHNDKIVFIIATNNKQLSHTIKKYYGNDFDAPNYLNKFYDLVYDLPEVDRKAFMSGYLKRKDDSYYHNTIPMRLADSLEMSMREITRYFSSVDIISDYLKAQNQFGSRVSDITKYLFVPLALALKITDSNKYHDFRTGKGTEILRELYAKDPVFGRLATQYVSKSGGEEALQRLEVILATYKELFSSLQDNNNYEIHEEQKLFQQVISLISATGKVDS